jgi:hypothetical protein
MTRILFAAVLIVVAVLGCFEDQPDPVSDDGTVVFLSFEGGFFGIVDDHGRHWDPSNLAEEFKTDSLRVRFEGIVTDLPTFHMWGRTIELTAVKRLK